jgi:cytoskeletal protein RodZ
MKSIGKTLREAREKQGLSIADVAARTKIHRHKLMAIEEGDKDLLPAKVFAVGLIKSYAKELKVDMKLIDELCQEAFRPEEVSLPVPPPSPAPPQAPEPQEKQSIGLFQLPKVVVVLASLSFIIALSFSIYLVAKKMNSYTKEEADAGGILQLEEPLNEPVAEDKSQPNQVTDAAADVKQAKIPEPAESSDTDKDIEDQDLDFSEDNNFAGENEPEPKKVATTTPPSNSAEPVRSENYSDQKLFIRALEPVRIEVIWSDGYNQGLLLKRNESKTLIFSSPIVVRIDNGGAVQVTFNDQKREVPGPLNKPIELNYP